MSLFGSEALAKQSDSMTIIKDHLTRRDGPPARFGCRRFTTSSPPSPPTTIISFYLSIRQNVLSFLSPTYIKPYPQRTRERLRPEPQRTVPFAIEALGGRIMAAEPEHHFKGLRGELPS